MKLTSLVTLLFAVALVGTAPRPAAAQSDVTTGDIQRLQDTIYDVSRDVSQLRSRDAPLASQLQSELDDARDETVYLKVKLRKNERISRSDFADLRDRVENIRSRARGEGSGGYTPPPSTRSTSDDRRDYPPTSPSGRVQTSNPNEVPVGTEFDVRLQNSLGSATS